MTQRLNKLKEAIKEFENSKGGVIPIGTKTHWSEFLPKSPFTEEEKTDIETLGYRYLGEGALSGAFGWTDHEFEYIGTT